MKLGLSLILVLLLGSVAAHFLLENNGYVLISFRSYTIEMSVPVLVFLSFATYLAVRMLVRLWQAPRELGEMAARARKRNASQRINKGFIALSEGRLAKGEKLLTRGAAQSETPLLNYLTAARAAQAQGDRQRRDSWLKMAEDSDAATRNAVLLTRAELQLAGGEMQPARNSIASIRETQPNHPQALKLLGELLFQEQDWRALTDLLPVLRKTKIISSRKIEEWTIAAFEAELAAPNLDLESINAHWNKLPRALRKNDQLIRARIRAMITGHHQEEAAAEIRKAINAQWDNQLVALFATLSLTDKDAQLQQTEKWLNQHPEDAVVLLAAGRCCLRSQLWGKARSYIESSIAIKPTPAAYHELGQLMLKLNNNAAATSAFAKGLTLSNAGVPDLPRLVKPGA